MNKQVPLLPWLIVHLHISINIFLLSCSSPVTSIDYPGCFLRAEVAWRGSPGPGEDGVLGMKRPHGRSVMSRGLNVTAGGWWAPVPGTLGWAFDPSDERVSVQIPFTVEGLQSHPAWLEVLGVFVCLFLMLTFEPASFCSSMSIDTEPVVPSS